MGWMKLHVGHPLSPLLPHGMTISSSAHLMIPNPLEGIWSWWMPGPLPWLKSRRLRVPTSCSDLTSVSFTLSITNNTETELYSCLSLILCRHSKSTPWRTYLWDVRRGPHSHCNTRRGECEWHPVSTGRGYCQTLHWQRSRVLPFSLLPSHIYSISSIYFLVPLSFLG